MREIATCLDCGLSGDPIEIGELWSGMVVEQGDLCLHCVEERVRRSLVVEPPDVLRARLAACEHQDVRWDGDDVICLKCRRVERRRGEKVPS